MSDRRALLRSYIPLTLENALTNAVVEPLRRDHGTVLVADVSGFTLMTAALSEAEGGVEQLQIVLNDGFGRLIDAVVAYGGDVVGFAGDALIAFFAGDDSTLHRSARAALMAQASLRVSHHDVPIRIGLASGDVDFWILGRGGDPALHAMGGPAFVAASEGQTSARPGEVIVASDSIAQRSGLVTEPTANPRIATVIDIDGAVTRQAPDLSPLLGVSDEQVAAFIPDAVRRRLDGGVVHLSELRPVTTIFVAVPDFGSLPASETEELIARMQEIVSDQRGVLAKLSLDEKGASLLCGFGIPPTSHIDDPRRGVATAVRLAEYLRATGQRFGIGVATGQTFCGTIGNDVRREYTLLGETVNTAARMANIALDPHRPAILCDEATVAGSTRWWTFATALSVRMKGRAELLIAREPVEARRQAIQADVPLVGRDRELGSALSAAESSLVVLEGEPGIGKSQLLQAINDHERSNGRLVLRGAATEMSFSQIGHPWAPILRSVLTLRSDGSFKDRLMSYARDHAPLVAAILGEDMPDNDVTRPLRGERRQTALVDVVVEILGRVAREQATTILLEDVHWCDEASWEIVTTAAAIEGLSIVATARPLPPARLEVLGEACSFERIVLGPFSHGQTAELVDVFCAKQSADLDRGKITDIVFDRCAGHPFFTAEVLKAFAQTGFEELDRGDAFVPGTILSALTARLDQLSADESLTLRIASMIGMTFDVATLQAVDPLERSGEELEGVVAGLANQDFVHVEEGSVSFAHAFFRDAAAKMMLPTQQAGVHQALAKHYVASGAALLRPGLVAAHWLAAGDSSQASRYFMIASDEANVMGATRTSIELVLRAVSALGVEVDPEPGRRVSVIASELRQLDQLLAGRSPKDLRRLPEVDDPTMDDVMALLLAAMPAAHRLEIELFELIALKGVVLLLRFGRGRAAAGILSMYSLAHRLMGRDPDEAFAFSETGLVLAEEQGVVELTRARFLHCWFNLHRHAPLAEAIELGEQGFKDGWPHVNPGFAAYCSATSLAHLAAAGASVDETVAKGQAYAERLGLGHPVARWYLEIETQYAKALAGRTESPVSFTDGWLSEEALLEAMGDTSLRAHYNDLKMRLHYLLGEYQIADAHRAVVHELEFSLRGKAAEVDHGVFASLLLLARCRAGELSAADAKGALAMVDETLEKLRTYEGSCEATFAHKIALIDAGRSEGRHDLEAALTGFRRARELAHEAGFVQYEALAAEAASRVARTLDISDDDDHKALEAASRWGIVRVRQPN